MLKDMPNVIDIPRPARPETTSATPALGDAGPLPGKIPVGDRLGWLARWATAVRDAHRAGVPF